MLKRTISGAVYVLILTGFFLLRQFVYAPLFHILTWFMCIMGTFELARAFKNRLIKGVFTTALVFSAIFVPAYAVGEYLLGGYGLLIALDLVLVGLIDVSAIAFFNGKSTKELLSNALLFVYPALFLLTMLLANDLPGDKGFLALLMAFVVSPCSDTFAYLTGSLIGGPKLCPKLSPKKTWAGAIGGTVGGVLSGLVVYFIFTPQINFFSPVLFFIGTGLIASVLTLLGDLFESGLKRSVGIKDMGKIMPGHGGVLDRIDGTLFATVFLYFAFLLV